MTGTSGLPEDDDGEDEGRIATGGSSGGGFGAEGVGAAPGTGVGAAAGGGGCTVVGRGTPAGPVTAMGVSREPFWTRSGAGVTTLTERGLSGDEVTVSDDDSGLTVSTSIGRSSGGDGTSTGVGVDDATASGSRCSASPAGSSRVSVGAATGWCGAAATEAWCAGLGSLARAAETTMTCVSWPSTAQQATAVAAAITCRWLRLRRRGGGYASARPWVALSLRIELLSVNRTPGARANRVTIR